MLDELVQWGRRFRVVECDGKTPAIIVDQGDQIITILAGHPHGQNWDAVHTQMSMLFQEAGGKV
ncbi:hypothetical protein J3R82DRAFT_2847 [Butyriboletus roseoflavus]|nr:hypothetical protein J3R82DRAFT_2847 [Butyriboletus roseoflavus]